MLHQRVGATSFGAGAAVGTGAAATVAYGPLDTISTPCPDLDGSNLASGPSYILHCGVYPMTSSTNWNTSGLTYFEFPMSIF